MPDAPLLTPFFTMMLLTMVVWLYMYSRRIPFIRQLDVPPDQLTPAELMRRSPPEVSNPSDNLKNLFELPVVFYAVILYVQFAGLADGFYLALAWVFVLFRILHSAIHCTINIVLWRFGLYAVSALALWIMVLRASFTQIGS